MATFELLAIISILAVAFIGGYLPLFHPERAHRAQGFAVTALVRLVLGEACHL